MINIRFEEREKIGLQYALETLHGCSPFGQEKIRKLRYYSPDEREELETELYNVEQAAKAADALKPLYDRIGLMLAAPVPGAGGPGSCGAVRNQGISPAAGESDPPVPAGVRDHPL